MAVQVFTQEEEDERKYARCLQGLRPLHLDFETYSECDLRACGAYVYSKHFSTIVHVAYWAFGSDEPQRWLPGMPMPPEIFYHILMGGEIHAYNASFERLIWENVMGPQHGWLVPHLEQFRCIMVQALSMALPGALEMSAPALKLDVRKDQAGSRVMLQLAKPKDKKKGIRDPETGLLPRWIRELAPKKFDVLDLYCAQDVRTEQAVESRVARMKDSELQLWFMDQRLNDRGVYIDKKLVVAAQKIVAQVRETLDDAMLTVTDFEVNGVSAAKQLMTWLKDGGVDCSKVDEDTLDELLVRDDLTTAQRRAIELRLEGAKASVSKLEAFLSRVDEDGRIRGTIQFFGASTGRWAARGIQTQNMPKPEEDFDVEGAIDAIFEGDISYIEMMFGPVLSVVSQCLRSMICAAPKNVLMAADFSQIEARVVAWLAGQDSVLEAFKALDAGTGPDLYRMAAAQVYGIPVSEVTKDQRAVGKIAILALGFGGGAVAYAKMARKDKSKLDLASIYDSVLAITSDDNVEAAGKAWTSRGRKSGLKKRAYLAAEMIKLSWRDANPMIVTFWYELEKAAVAACRNPGTVYEVGLIKYKKTGSFLKCTLPSGRAIYYPYARVKQTKTPWGADAETVWYKTLIKRKWVDKNLYGGLACENVTQGTARDIIAEAKRRLEKAHYWPVMSIHDEAVCEVKKGFGSYEEFLAIFRKAPHWTQANDNRPALPIAASGWEGHRFRK